MRSEQFRKKGIALMQISKMFFLLQKGNRAPTIDELCEELDLSRGTIQVALNTLKDIGAITIRSRGHLGTLIEGIDQEKLLGFIDNRIIVAAMPLPYTKRYEGLATGVQRAFGGKKLKMNLAYMSGSNKRLEGLLSDRYDFIITSGLAADYMTHMYPVTKIMELPQESYLSEHVVIFPEDSEPIIKDGMKIGVDSNSIDYALLTKEIQKNHDIEMVEVPYNQIVSLVKNHKVDAAIWNKDEIDLDSDHVIFKSIDSPETVKSSKAAILVKEGNQFITKVVTEYLKPTKLSDIQSDVMKGLIFPEY